MPPKKNKPRLNLWAFLRTHLYKQWLTIKRLFANHTRQYLLKALWLFFPSILFLALAYFVFWRLPQGKDLIVITMEDPKGKTTFVELFCFLVALVFWVYVTWYSTRLVARAKCFQQPDDDKDPVWKTLRIQTPRVLAFSCITIILLAFFQLDYYGYPKLSSRESHLILLFSYAWYFFIYEIWMLFIQVHRSKRNNKQWESFLKITRHTVFWLLVFFAAITMWIKSFTMVVALLAALQIGLVLLMIIRKELDEVSNENITKGFGKVTPESGLWKRMKYIIWYDENRKYVKVFMVMSAVALGFYFSSIIDIRVAVFIGPFPFVLLAFGVLLGFGNIVTFLSVLKKTNFHFILFVFALLFGRWFDSHKLNLPRKESFQPEFYERQNLKEYFTNWMNDPDRQAILKDSSKPKYPVYFVMANGGASRSGYWTAKILSGLEDSSGGRFSKHLFCLSGASGGSVGNATFFSLLRARDSLAAKKISFTQASADYLRSDFLTYTLSHLLGPDIFRNFFPFINLIEMDRGRALARSLEKAPDKKNCFLYDSFGVKFSSFITQKNDRHYKLPIFCINVTRMRDGNPAVFSNIRLGGLVQENNYFNNRVDILTTLGESRDIKLSTAVTLGASFPYISPAGRIDYPRKVKDDKGELHDETDSQYFVDGGYFDNSGAGVVNEMIFAINNMMEKDDSLKKYKGRLEFFVLHILNTDPKKDNRSPLNSMTNDLMAPFKTMLGSYGKQTTVNDQRLRTYLYSIYGDDLHYKSIDLYDAPLGGFRFSMNWVISDKQLAKMNEALIKNTTYQNEKKLMAGWSY